MNFGLQRSETKPNLKSLYLTCASFKTSMTMKGNDYLEKHKKVYVATYFS
jgi:hypothetical protein